MLASKHLSGWKTIGYVEISEYCQKVIAQGIKDGLLDEAPIFGDIQAFNRDGYAPESIKGWLMSCPGVSRARISVVQKKVQESKEACQGCGLKCTKRLAFYDLDTSSWKIAHSLLSEVLHWSSVNLPKWGTLHRGVLSEQKMPTFLKKRVGKTHNMW